MLNCEILKTSLKFLKLTVKLYTIPTSAVTGIHALK